MSKNPQDLRNDSRKEVLATAISVVSDAVKDTDRVKGTELLSSEEFAFLERSLLRMDVNSSSEESAEPLLVETCQRVKDGTVPMKSREDISAFSSLVFCWFLYGAADAVRYYIETGEILEAISKIDEAYNQHPDSHGAGAMPPLPYGRKNLRLLYAFDMSQEELGNQGDDETAARLPLEIRMNFAGCFESPPENEDES